MKKILLLSLGLITLSSYASQVCKDTITATTTTSRLIINGDNTITDNATGLTWMRCSLGQTGKDCNGGSAQSYTWAEALNEVGNNHGGWRLPNITELRSIVELKCYDPAINIIVFPNTLSESYWSSSPRANNYDGAVWSVDFVHGSGFYDNKNKDGYVRLVRGGQ